MQKYMIAKAKRIADQYGVWIEQGYVDRQERLEQLLSNEPNPKIRGKARSLINHRYGE
jgi:hypothetical protein